jgi:hypothetical protein
MEPRAEIAVLPVAGTVRTWSDAMTYKMDKQRTEDRRKLDFDRPSPGFLRPFDARELDSLPQPRDDDPPYRPWWVVERS